MPQELKNEMLQELSKEWPEQTILHQQIIALYEHDSGQKLSSPKPTKNEMEAVVRWLNLKGLEKFYLRHRNSRVPVFAPSLSSKVSVLAQFHCPICETKDGLFPVSVISIRISPVSKQAIKQKPKRLAAFEKAILYRLKDKSPLPADSSICLLIVFVVKAGGSQKDLDNMAKAIVDAVKNVLFGDDRKIDHLNIIRIKSPDEEYIYLNIRQTQLNEHKDVLFPYMFHSWAGAEELNLDDFM